VSDVSTGADATERPESAAEAVSRQGHRTGAESPADSPPRTSNRHVRITCSDCDASWTGAPGRARLVNANTDEQKAKRFGGRT
jgi:hypothetical protein